MLLGHHIQDSRRSIVNHSRDMHAIILREMLVASLRSPARDLEIPSSLDTVMAPRILTGCHWKAHRSRDLQTLKHNDRDIIRYAALRSEWRELM
jgi:hypothetical protein